MLRPLGCLLLVLVLGMPRVHAEEPLPVNLRWVEAALADAGENRAELERVLTHFAGDERKLAAAR